MFGSRFFKVLLAAISWVAVLVGAFEHEHLILQPTLSVEASSASEPVNLSETRADLSPSLNPTGTEGTFRFEAPAVALTARQETGYPLPRPKALASLREKYPYRAALPPRPPLIGILALRL